MTSLWFGFPISVALCLASAVAAHGQNMPSQLIGAWRVDVERTLVAMQEAGSPQDPEMARQILPGATVEFADGGKVTMTMDVGGIEQVTRASYQIAGIDEANRTVHLAVTIDEMPDQKNSAAVTILTDDSIKLATDDGNVLVLIRVEE